MKIKDLEKDSVRRLKIDDSADNQRLDNFLLTQLKGVPKSRIYKLVRGGEVRINGGRVDVGYRLQLGDEVRIPPVRMAAPAVAATPRLPPSVNRLLPHVLYRDEALIAHLLHLGARRSEAGHDPEVQGHTLSSAREARQNAAFLARKFSTRTALRLGLVILRHPFPLMPSHRI